MKNFKYLSWISGILFFAFGVYKVGLLIHPDTGFLKEASVIFNYKIINGEKSSLSLGQVCLSLIILILGITFASLIKDKVIGKLLNKTNLSLGTQASIQNFSHYFLVLLSFIMAFNVANIPLTIFAFLGGAVAIGLGFGSQNILNNFISGVIIQTEKPLNVGDIIEIEDIRGTVISIGARSTKLLSPSSTHIILPNSYFLDKKFINWTLFDKLVRSYIKITLDYKDNPEIVASELLKLVKADISVEEDPEPKIFVENYNENGIEYGIYVWFSVSTPMGKTELESNLRMKIYKLIKDNHYKFSSHNRKLFVSGKIENND